MQKMSKNTNFHNTIERCPHDEENPYTQILNALIRDKSISPNCRMIIIYLLSNKSDWRIRIPHLITEFKDHLGKDAIYKIVNEAIEAGYIRREEYIQNNLKRYRYFLSEKPKFKKILRYPEFQDTGAPDTENTDTKQRTSKERTTVSVCAESGPVDPPPRLEKLKIKTVEGKDILLTKELLFQEAVLHKKDWTAEEIDKLWEVLAKYTEPVRDLILFCDGTVKNLRKMQALKQLNIKTNKPKNKTCKNTQNLNKPSENSKGLTLTKDMLVRPFQNWTLPPPPPRKSNDLY
jgi:hypothetical protein